MYVHWCLSFLLYSVNSKPPFAGVGTYTISLSCIHTFLFDLKVTQWKCWECTKEDSRIRSDQLKILKRSSFEKISQEKSNCCWLRGLWWKIRVMLYFQYFVTNLSANWIYNLGVNWVTGNICDIKSISCLSFFGWYFCSFDT